MSSLNYDSDCSQLLSTHVCDQCPDTESGRIGTVFLVDDDIEFVDPQDIAEWTTFIEAGRIQVIPNVRGSFNGGTPVKKPAFGRIKEKLTSYDFEAEYTDEVLYGNWEHYNTLGKVVNKRLWWLTETQLWMTDAPASFSPNTPITDSTDDGVYYVTSVTWSSSNLPEHITAPSGLEQCFTVVP